MRKYSCYSRVLENLFNGVVDMKKIVLTLMLALFFIVSADAHEPINNSRNFNNYYLAAQTKSGVAEERDPLRDKEIRNRDYALALVPGAVQMRRKWPAVAGSIWGGMAVTGGLAIYEQVRIAKLRNRMDGDPSNADWYHHKISQAKKIRNGSLIALGGIYVANYLTALLLPDRNPDTGYIALYADPYGAVGLTYALRF